MVDKHDLLYLVGYSPREGANLGDLHDILVMQNDGANIGVVLIHDGVIGTSKKGRIPEFLSDLLKLSLKVYAITPDLKARGINPDDIHDAIQGIEYGDLVDLMVESIKVISWM